jgi:hypothetical protein
MAANRSLQLSQILDPGDPDAVLAAARDIFTAWYPEDAFPPLAEAFERLRGLFEGSFPGYAPCDTEYHDLQHTTDVFLAAARLMDGRALEQGPLPLRVAEELFLAAMLHDTGYIQTAEESEEGTGARHTSRHVERSEEFARGHCEAFGFDRERAESIVKLIECTNMRSSPAAAGFGGMEGRAAGAILGTADLLGQMADRAYLEKLLFLYREFREAGIPGYHTEFDILRNTLAFYASTRDRLEGPLGGAYAYATRHFLERHGADANLYMESIEGQMGYLRTIIADDTSNFRKKLKRLDLESA